MENSTRGSTEGSLSGLVTAFSLNLVFTLVLNTVVLILLQHQLDIRDVPRFLHRVLAVVDLGMGFTWNPWSIFWFVFNDLQTCRISNSIFPFFQRFLALSILACVSFISIDRFILIKRPLRYPTLVTKPRVVRVVATSLSVIALVSLVYLPFPWFQRFTEVFTRNCFTGTWPFVTRTWENVFVSLYLVIPICSTLFILTLTNIALLCVARRQSRAIIAATAVVSNAGISSGDGNAVNHDSNRSSKRKVHRASYKGVSTVVILTLPFYFCWLPWIMFLTFYDVTGTLAILDAFGPAASWVRPIIYIVTTKEARGMCAKWGKRHILGRV